MVRQLRERVFQWVTHLTARREGQALVEYALILALVAIAAIVALHFLGGSTQNTVNNIANNLNSAG